MARLIKKGDMIHINFIGRLINEEGEEEVFDTTLENIARNFGRVMVGMGRNKAFSGYSKSSGLYQHGMKRLFRRLPNGIQHICPLKFKLKKSVSIAMSH